MPDADVSRSTVERFSRHSQINDMLMMRVAVATTRWRSISVQRLAVSERDRIVAPGRLEEEY